MLHDVQNSAYDTLEIKAGGFAICGSVRNLLPNGQTAVQRQQTSYELKKPELLKEVLLKGIYMQISGLGFGVQIECDHYRLDLAPVPRTSYILFKDSNRLFGFIAGGDCSLTGKWDASSNSGPWMPQELPDGTICLTREEKSLLWKTKRFCIHAGEDFIEWHHELEGTGDLDEIRWFRYCYEGNEYGFAGNFDEVYSAAPNFREQTWYHPTARVIISNGDDLSACSGGHALASVPHVMGLHDRRDNALLGTAVFAEPGEYLWDAMVWNPQVILPPTDYEGDLAKAGGFAIRYCGKKTVNGKWISPRLVFTFPEDAGQTLRCALEYAYGAKLLPRPGRHRAVDWWNEPIYCTWHDQCALAQKEMMDYHKPGIRAGELCTEALTEHWLQTLIDHDAKPGIVILDDKWQKSKLDAVPDTAKWPNLRGWIERCHERNIRVFLWELAWHDEDIPQEEAITRDGKIVCGDVTNPLYEARLRRKIHRYFSPDKDGLNADGLKIDGLMMLPTGRGLKNRGNLWGLELQKYFLRIVFEEARKAKPDACISTFAANPYLDEFTDMVRLADMYTYRLTTVDSMRLRRSVFAVTNPDVLTDTDGQLNFHEAPDYLDDLAIQAELGIPTVYNAEYLRRARFFFPPDYRKLSEADYLKFAEVFAAYRNWKKNGKTLKISSKHGCRKKS